MSKGYFILTILIVFSVYSTDVFSQVGMKVHVGSSIPISKFESSEINEENTGGGAVGLNIGLQLTQSLPINNLGLFVGIDFLYNRTKSGLRNELAKKSKEDIWDARIYYSSYDYDVSLNNYINIPISTGLYFFKKINNRVSLKVETGLVYNFLKITDMKTTVSRDEYYFEGNGFNMKNIVDERFKTKFDFASNFGYKVGCGLIFNEKTSVAINYFALGKHDADGEISRLSDGYTREWERSLKVDIVSLTIGLMF